MTPFGKLVSALVFTASAAFVPAASAQSDLDFVIENSTGYTIKEIYMSPNKKDTWGKQVLSSPLKNGEKRKIVFKPTAKIQAYDLKAVYMDGAGSPVWTNLDPSTFSRLQLKWDKAKGKSVAVKHRT